MKKKMSKPDLSPSLIVKVVTQKMFPFLLMFGVYIVFHGSSSPGGGFQGGVVIGVAYILFAIGMDPHMARKDVPESSLSVLRSAGVLIYMGIGLLGIVLGYTFLANRVAGIPPRGALGSVLSGGALLGINIGVGTTVSAVVITFFYAFLEYEPEKPNRETETEEENPV